MAEELALDIGSKKMLSEKRTLCFNYHDFESLSEKRGQAVQCPSSLLCHGHLWKLNLYPRGCSMSSSVEDYVSAMLLPVDEEIHRSVDVVDVNFSMRVGNGGHRTGEVRRAYRGSESWGWADLIKRSDVLDPDNGFLQNGTLSIKVDIQIVRSRPATWSPRGTLKNDLMDLFKRSDLADVTFSVGGEKVKAHKSILAVRAPGLATLLEDVTQSTEEIQIENVDASVFSAFLHFLYSDGLPTKPADANDCKALLNVADRYDCSTLKLQMEAKIAESDITVETAVELLLYADGKNCAHLRELAIDFIVANTEAVMASEGFSLLKQSPELLTELLGATVNPKVYSEDDDINNVDRMSVASLRRKLDEAGLDMDGTRDMLVKRLKRGNGGSA